MIKPDRLPLLIVILTCICCYGCQPSDTENNSADLPLISRIYLSDSVEMALNSPALDSCFRAAEYLIELKNDYPFSIGVKMNHDCYLHVTGYRYHFLSTGSWHEAIMDMGPGKTVIIPPGEKESFILPGYQTLSRSDSLAISFHLYSDSFKNMEGYKIVKFKFHHNTDGHYPVLDSVKVFSRPY